MKVTTAIKPSRTTKKFVLRLPIDIHEKILIVAKHQHRSMNAEIIHQLDKMISIQTHPLPKNEALSDEQYLLQLLQSLPSDRRMVVLVLLESLHQSYATVD